MKLNIATINIIAIVLQIKTSCIFFLDHYSKKKLHNRREDGKKRKENKYKDFFLTILDAQICCSFL